MLIRVSSLRFRSSSSCFLAADYFASNSESSCIEGSCLFRTLARTLPFLALYWGEAIYFTGVAYTP